MKNLSQNPKAIKQRRYRERQDESVVVVPLPIHKDELRGLLVRAGASADLAEHKHNRQAAGKALARWLESLDG